MLALWKTEWFKIRRRALSWVSLGLAGLSFTFCLWWLLLLMMKAASRIRLGALTFYGARLELIGFFEFFYYGNPITPGILGQPGLVLRTIVDFMVVLFAASVPDQGARRDVMRQWVSHGLRRTSYVLAQVLAMCSWLALAWCASSAIVLLVATHVTQNLLVDSIWQAAYASDIACLIAGNMLRYFSIGCFVYLVVVLAQKRWVGVLVGTFYSVMLGSLFFYWLDRLNLSALFPYTPFRAQEIVLFYSQLGRGELPGALLLFFVWGLVYLILAAFIFNRQDLTA